MKCVRNAAKRSYACLVDCPESRFPELLLLSSAKSCKIWTEGSADQEDRISGQSPGYVCVTFHFFHFITYSLGCGASCDSSDILA